jgi:hypothetical protein
MSMRREPDRLIEFSHRLAQIKFIILEIVIFIGFLLWLWDKVKHDFNINFAPTSAHGQTVETHDPCHITLPVFRSD